MLAVALLAIPPAIHAQDARIEALRERAQVAWTEVPRKVLAFYYGWYATPDVTGRWSHWDLAGERELANSTNFPELGPYDSHQAEVVEQHCQWAVAAGLDGLIASWWEPGDFHEDGLPLLLEKAEEHGLEVSAYFEIVPDRTPSQAARWVTRLLRRYGDHPAWLKVDGKPVLFVYGRALDQIGLDGWASAIATVNERVEGGAVFIGDEISRRAARVFDGVHTYNVTGATAGMSVDELRVWARRAYGEPNRVAPTRISCATVIPGYDDTKLGREGDRPVTARHDGDTYRVLWEEAIAADPDWILVTSFNEWHEGSEIEPSVENGDRELLATADFANRFRALPPRERPARHTDPAHAERLSRIRELYREHPVAILPEGDSEGMWALLASGIPTVGLDWDEIVDPEAFTPQRFPVVLYACGEEYRATVEEPDDVLHALERYVDGGGILVALSSGPMPFYYARGVGACEHWWRLGFPLRVHHFPDEEGLELAVVDRDALPSVPATFPVPTELRWRPLVDGLGPEVEAWIRLRGSDGTVYDTAVGLVPRGRGSLVYAWFGLFDLDVGEALLLDLWAQVAKRIPLRREVERVDSILRERFDLDEFYRKVLVADGFPIVSSARVSDYALKEAAYLIDAMLAPRPELREALVENRIKLAVMAFDEFTTDVPEHARLTPKDYWDRRARGLGATRASRTASCAEENLLGYRGDPYWTENILIHEFAHTIHTMALRSVDRGFDEKLQETYSAALAAGLWEGTYAATNRGEYWAEGVQSWFDTNRQDDSEHNHVDTRAELVEYDPALASLLESVFGDGDWRYVHPARRDSAAHLEGHEPDGAPTFTWPERLRK